MSEDLKEVVGKLAPSSLVFIILGIFLLILDVFMYMIKSELIFGMFIWLVYEVFERMAYYGIASNLVIFMTTKLHQGTVKSSNNVTNWVGTSWLTPIFGAYVADAHLDRYVTFVISSAIYLLVLIFLYFIKILNNHIINKSNMSKDARAQENLFS